MWIAINYFLLILITSIIFNFSAYDVPTTKLTTYSSDKMYSIKEIDELEKFYIENMVPRTLTQNTVCLLSNCKKQALCQLIFQLKDYNSLGIHLNKIAFSIANSTCVKRRLRFRIFSSSFIYKNYQITQSMYPCYGRHNPIRTSFIEDDFYEEFYISGGPIDNSIFIYHRKYNEPDSWYNLHEYIGNIIFTELPDTCVNLVDVLKELRLNKDIIRTRDQREIEYIFYREHSYLPTKDPVCALNKERKAALCQMVFERSNPYGITLNKAAFYIFQAPCMIRRIQFYYVSDKRTIFLQDVLPCYGRDESNTSEENVLTDEYFEWVYVSSGPRRNSLLVFIPHIGEMGHYYYQPNLKHRNSWILFEIIENFSLQKLQPMHITLQDLEEESLTTKHDIQEINLYVKLFENTLQEITNEKNKIKILRNKRNIEQHEDVINQLERRLEKLKTGIKRSKVSLEVRKMLIMYYSKFK